MDDHGTSRLATARVWRSFAWRSLAVFLLVGAISHLVVRGVVDDHFRDALEFHAGFVTETIVAPALTGGDGAVVTADADVAEGLAELVRRDEQVLAIELLDAGGTVVMSVGGVALDGREVSTTVVPLAAARDEPAAVRVVQDATPTRAAAARLTRMFDAILLLGLLGLWAVLLPMAARLGRRLGARAEELERQGAELRRLLDREHETVARLEEVSELKDRFLTAVSHELRTPLTIVIGSLMTLQRQPGLDPALRCDLLGRAERSAGKLEELLTGLLDLNGGARSGPPRRERVDLPEVVSAAVAQLPPRTVVVDLEVADVVGDPVQLERVVAHLVGNAIRHAPGDAPVLVRSRSSDGAIELTVADRGPGVPDELKQAVFEPFRQGDLRDAHSPGTGIGLSLVARFAGDHGGRAWVEDRPGGGATFHVRLPVLPDPPGPNGGAAAVRAEVELAGRGSLEVRPPRSGPGAPEATILRRLAGDRSLGDPGSQPPEVTA